MWRSSWPIRSPRPWPRGARSTRRQLTWIELPEDNMAEEERGREPGDRKYTFKGKGSLPPEVVKRMQAQQRYRNLLAAQEQAHRDGNTGLVNRLKTLIAKERLDIADANAAMNLRRE